MKTRYGSLALQFLCRRAVAIALAGVIIGSMVFIGGVLVATLIAKRLKNLKPRELPPEDEQLIDSTWMDGLPAQLYDYAEIINTNRIGSVYVFGSWSANPTNADGSEPMVWERVGIAATRIERSVNLSTWTSVCTMRHGATEPYEDDEVTIRWMADNSGVEISRGPQAPSSVFYRSVPE